ncbi:MAG TPA: hypothetical protein QF800_04050 [Phycisphaerales bacterium]|nr:hypothetical protein [Phycisphaerales bacterium]
MLNSPEQIAAISLGSNSFDMVVAYANGGRLLLVDRIDQRCLKSLDRMNRRLEILIDQQSWP